MSLQFLLIIVCLYLTSASVVVKRSASGDDDVSDDASQCSYSFNVLASTGEACPDDSSLDELRRSMRRQFSDLESKLDTILAALAQQGNSTGAADNDDVSGNGARAAVNYKRWGRRSCPDTASLVYEGVMAKSYFSHGGGVNFLCMPLDPEFPANAVAGHQTGSYVYGVEYRSLSSSPFFSEVNNQDAPCAVCEVHGRSQVLMIPAKQTCPVGWTLEYEGLLASQYYTNKGSEFVCIASGMEASHSGSTSESGGLLYVAEAACGSLPCSPYINGYEITCVVCTK